MASLTNTKIKDTYDGLLKTTDNDALGGTYKLITDGLGNSSGVYLGTGGNVGIGQSSPTTYKLDVNGTFRAVSTAYFESGINAASYIYHSGDTNTFFGFPANDTFTVTTNNAERMRIDSSGNVGIGTNDPDTFLHIDSASTNNIPLKVESGASTSFVQFMDTATTANFKVRVGSSGDNLVLFAGGSERMRINSSGNVQIGSGTRYGKFDILNIGGSGTNFIISAGSNGDNYFTSGTSGIQVFRSGSTERMRINSSGNVGIGTSSITDSRLQIKGANNTTNAYADGLKVTSNNETVYTQYNWNGINNNTLLLFATGGTERMRINSSGNVLIGTTSTLNGNTDGLHVDALGSTHAMCVQSGGNGYGIVLNNSAGTAVGSIVMNASTTTYNTSSDYRLKENVVDMTGALDRVDQLEPKRFNFISNAETTVDGFIAHEVQSVIPEAITGEKDAVDDEGNPEYQGIDQSKIVPLLVGAIKELKAEIETLKSQINS